MSEFDLPYYGAVPPENWRNAPLTIFNQLSGLVLVHDEEHELATQRALRNDAYDNKDGVKQDWRLVPVPLEGSGSRTMDDRYVNICPSYTERSCLEGDESGMHIKTRVAGNHKQQWQLSPVGDGFHALINRAGRKVLAANKRDRKLVLKQYNGQRDQLWKIIRNIRPQEWMSRLPKDLSLSAVSMPGTHDSGATGGVLWAKTQDLNIEAQLEAGVRYLDIRARVKGEELSVVHSSIDMDLPVYDVVNSCASFLSRRSRETIILQLKKEGQSDSDFMVAAQKIFERGRWYRDHWIPTLEEARGKIVLFNRFCPYPGPYGLDVHWPDNQTFASTYYAVQDEYNPDATFGVVKEKERAIASFFDKYCYYPRRYNINFTSAASARTPEHYARDINPWLADKLMEMKREWNAIVTMDYVEWHTEDSISNIILNNYYKRPAWTDAW